MPAVPQTFHQEGDRENATMRRIFAIALSSRNDRLVFGKKRILSAILFAIAIL
ncbi:MULTISPECIES: hypothetical protein [unclassified Microcoleus]|uniref:hypothetical protein n=1 Tax=unclassified Microcoleus TaxID=2642155 RepID=UPI0025DD29F9|nr:MULTISPECIES: hypothetical protein [unclassified Microcoleus]